MAEPPRLAPASPGLAPLQGRVALVTGGARRVGAAIVRRLAGAGAAVVIHYQHSRGEAEALLGELQQQGAHGVALAADLRQPSEISWLFSAAPRLLGPVELLVNNAAIFLRQPRAEITVAGWEQVQQVNLRAPFLCIQAAVPQIRGQGGGAIVNIADLAGLQAWPDASAHCAAKAGLVALTRSLALALELAPAIRVNAVAPSLVLPAEDEPAELRRQMEGRIPRGPTGSPQDVAEAVLFLLGHPAITGAVLPVDGGRLAGAAVRS